MNSWREIVPNDELNLSRARELRKRMTFPERKLWEAVRNRRLKDLRFRRQHPILEYIVDFVCIEHLLIIELDGISLIGCDQYDRKRQTRLEDAGFRVIRFTNNEVLQDFEFVLDSILKVCGLDCSEQKAN